MGVAGRGSHTRAPTHDMILSTPSMKAANKVIRSKQATEGKILALVALVSVNAN